MNMPYVSDCEGFNYRKCSSLKPNENVIFYAEEEFNGVKSYVYFDGAVVDVNIERGIVWVDYLYSGYKDETKPVPFNRMVAVYNKNGKYLRVPGIEGCSDLLTAE